MLGTGRPRQSDKEIKKVGQDRPVALKLYCAGVKMVSEGVQWGGGMQAESMGISPAHCSLPHPPSLQQPPQPHYDLLCLFAGTAVERLNFLIFINPSRISEGTFCRPGPGTEFLLSMQRHVPILTALMGSGRGNTLTVNCLLRALERAPALARQHGRKHQLAPFDSWLRQLLN